MNTQQAYINGFVKRAAEYGYNRQEALEIYKQATAADAPFPAKVHSKPINIPSPAQAPVRQFGMTANQMQNAQNTLNNGGELNLAGG